MYHPICGFEHLHRHSDFSLLDGFATVEEYCQRQREINQKFLCITDHGVMGAVPQQVKYSERYNLNPIFGCELYVNPMQPKTESRAESAELRKTLGDPDSKDKKKKSPDQARFDKSNHLLAIAYTNEGYSNLVRLTSWAWMHGYYRRPRVNHDVLKQYKKGIIFTTTCANSEIATALFNEGEDSAFQKLEQYIDMFGTENFLLEIMMLDFKLQKPYNEFLIKCYEKYDLQIILSQDCFVQGTPVLTRNGFKDIEDIAVGEFVLTHKGRWREVEEIGSRSLRKNENVYKVKTRVGTYAYEATANHEVYVASRKEGDWEKSWKKTENLLVGEDFLLIPKICQNDIFSDQDLDQIDLMPFLSDQFQIGNKYESSNKGNMACRLQYNELTQEFWSYRGWNRKFKTSIPRYLKIDEDFLMMLGWYIAEGWSEKKSNQVGFAFHIDEKNIAKWLMSYFKKFGITSKIYTVSKNGIALRFSSVVFNKVLGSMCGLGANNKKLPCPDGITWMKSWSKKQLVTILSKYWKGDGCGSDDYTSFGSTSKHLIFDISVVLNSMKMFSYPCREFGKKESWNDKWYITVCKNKTKQIQDWFVEESELDFDDPRVRGTKYFEMDDYYAVPITDVDVIEYDKKVFCFQVAEDHTFTAGLWSVSNCHYCRKEHSHNQRLMLMQKNRRTIQEINALIESDEAEDLFELQDENLWLKSEDELNAKWESDYKDSIDYEIFKIAKENTVKVAERAKGVEIDRTIKLPQTPDSDIVLWEEIKKGFLQRHCPKTAEYSSRIREEYELICEKGFASYFIIQQMMTDEARKEGPSILGYGDGSDCVGPGRGCLKGDTHIDTGDGLTVSISEIKKGQEVRTLDGSLKKVEKVWEYDLIDESLLNIKTYYGDALGVSLTGDHKVYAEKQVRPKNWDNWSESTKKSRKTFEEPTGNLSWIRADELSVGDWCFLPIPKVETWDDFKIDLADGKKSFKNGKKLRYDDDFVHHEFNSKFKGRSHCVSERIWNLTEDWATVLGIFVGDGWTCSDDRSQVGFCSHVNEEFILEYVESVLSDGFGCGFTWKKNHDGKQVTQLIVKSIYAHNLFKFLHPCYYNSSDTKHVPSCILNAPEEIVLAYLKGYFLADGHEDDHKIKFETTSRVLASQIRYLLLRVGVPSSLGYDDRIDEREEFANRKLAYVITCPLFEKIGASRDFYKQYCWRTTDKGIMLRVREMTEQEGSEKVYDLQVADNHNYMTSSFLVHNSACGSLVAYCLRLHDVEPIKHDLKFSRFLSPARGGKQMKIRHNLEPIPHGDVIVHV